MPIINWWVHCVLENRDRIISLVELHRAQYLRRNHKFWIELPKMVKENENSYEQDAISKEGENEKVAFQVNDEETPNCY